MIVKVGGARGFCFSLLLWGVGESLDVALSGHAGSEKWERDLCFIGSRDLFPRVQS